MMKFKKNKEGSIATDKNHREKNVYLHTLNTWQRSSDRPKNI